MRECDVRSVEQALAYITDCNLATVCEMACKKSRPRYEFDRQRSIAQKAVNWMREMGVSTLNTRAEDIPAGIDGVYKRSEQFMPELKK